MKRNDTSTQIHGISASRKFWERITQFGQDTGMTRSAALVEIVSKYFNDPSLTTNPVGRPKKKRVKHA
jgi:predicted DNA-binding protein